MTTSVVPVSLHDRSYDVTVGDGVLDSLAERLTERFAHRRVFIVADTGIDDAVVQRVERLLSEHGFGPTVYPFEPTEKKKSLTELQAILGAMTDSGHERGEPVVALGGGIVGDLAGFAAAVYRRGVPIVQCPTTLLAMVDASVGGKTGVNLATGPVDAPTHLHKNMVGSFHQPAFVLADVSTLKTLAPRHLRSGLAECVKHGMLAGRWGDPDLLDEIRDRVDQLLATDPDALTSLVTRNVSIKAAVVASDEREEATDPLAGRAHLNLGHTFAHAFETLEGVHPPGSGTRDLHHGEAVAVGLVAASRASELLKLCDASVRPTVTRILDTIGLPTSLEGLPDVETVRRRMQADKKVLSGSLRLIVPDGPATCRTVDDPPNDVVLDAIETVRA